MSDRPELRHGLEPFLAAAPSANDAGLSIAVNAGAAIVNLRGDPANAAFVTAVEEAIGQALPVTPNTFSRNEHRVYWLGPDEWLVIAEEGGAALAARLEGALDGMRTAVNDVSGGSVALRIEGTDTRHVLAKGCTLDLHPAAFGVGACAQSGLARANVLLGCLGEAPEFEIVVRRSFADYLGHWLAHAGRHVGTRWSEG